MAEKSLEERMSMMEERMQRTEDTHEIQQVMNKYERYLEVGLWDEIVELFALKTPGVRADVGWGNYEGPEKIKKLFLGIHKEAFGDQKTGMRPGVFGALFNTTPIIEVAGDGKTAKGIWGVIGAGTMRYGGQEGTDSYDEGEMTSQWNLCMRATDFVKEDGEWKIWHYTVHGYFGSPFDTCWSDLEVPHAIFDHS